MQDQNRGIIGNIAVKPIAFAVAFAALFLLAVGFLNAVDALPDPSNTPASSDAPEAQVSTISQASKVSGTELPTRVVAASVGIDQKVVNPSSTDVDALDQDLLSGTVRYPTSAKLNENGTVLIFGHSSYLPIVHNQAYKEFDGIQNLKDGDTVSVYSATTEYRYSVTKVEVANADEDVIELPKDGKYLTLVTCDSFTKKTDRFVVTAKFVGAYQLASN